MSNYHADLVKRLHNLYPVSPITIDGTPEFGYRLMKGFNPPIQREAAGVIEMLLAELNLLKERQL